MRISDRRPRRYKLIESERYLAALERIAAAYPLFEYDPLQNFEFEVTRDPHNSGIRIPSEGRETFFAVTPPAHGTPSLRIFFEIDDDRVILWSVSERDESRAGV